MTCASLLVKNTNKGKGTITIVNAIGQIVYSVPILPTGKAWQQEIQLGQVAKRIYLLRVQTATHSNILRVSIQ